jgi:DNA polymerase III subunit alpha
MAEFAHLHVHTQYSTLDGALRVKDLAKRTAALGMKAVAITDHANMFGAIQLHKYAKEFGVSPIFGCELNVVRPRAGARGAGGPLVDHVIALAASEEGYKNLIGLVSRGHTHPAAEGVPSLTLEAFEGKTKGLVGLTGCMGGVVQQRILDEGEAAGEAALGRLKELFEPGHLFVEVQEHGLPEQPVVGGILSSLAVKLGLPLVGTNVVHFKERADGEAQLLLQCIQTGRSLKDAKEGHHGSFEMFLKSPDEMEEALRDYPGAAENTLRVAEMCTGWKLKLGTPMLPNFPVPAGMTPDDYFRQVAREGLERRFAEFEALGKKVDREAYRKRLEVEADIIVKMKFPGYFLIVWDFIRYGKENGIPVGPGRGSGAGSLVAYAMRITDLDPIPYDLLFERFLNPERVSMPDFDVDFCMDKRDRVIQYVAQKYGKDSVGQIATFHELKARSVIKDVARAMQFEPVESGRIASMIPIKGAGQTYTIPEVLKDNIEPKLTALMATDARVKELIEQAQRLEGLTRHAGMHAAGVVISEGPIWDHVPVFVNGATGPAGPEDGATLVTQYYKDDVELAGLVKFDFLGLKTLTVLDICEKLVRLRPDQDAAKPFELATIPMDDKPAYALMQAGDTTGVFQLESSGMQQLFRDLKPDVFEDIVAAVALYRPGPLETGMVKDFVECKHGRQPIKKMHALIDEVLAPTYGVIVYQEQVMQIAQKLAGYTLGGADLLRRAMGKKKPEEMAKQKGTFVEGSLKNGVPAEESSAIFDLVEKFAGYGFNKSHSAAYALLTYQTAYLKANYPVEFLCALMTADKEKIEKVVRIIAEARAWGVKVLPPDVNESDTDFKVVYASPAGDHKPPRGSKVRDVYQPQIRFGLGAVRGIGEAALVSVFEAREGGGPFTSLFDFSARVDAKKLNRGVLEALVQGGAFDKSLNAAGVTRSRAFAAIDLALERARSASRDRESGQTSLLDLFAASAPKGTQSDAATFPAADPWDLRETLVREKQSLGFYVSGHPLDRYGRDMGRFEVRPTTDLPGMDDWAAVKIAGMVEGYREKVFKGGGGKVAFFELEDTVGRVKVKVRDRQIQEYSHLLTAGEPVLLSGKLSFPQQSEDEGEGDAGPRDPTLFLNEVRSLSEAIRAETRGVTLRLREGRVKPEVFAQLRRVLEGSPGPCPVNLVLELESEARAHLNLPGLRVEPSDAMLAGLERLFGEKVAELR